MIAPGNPPMHSYRFTRAEGFSLLELLLVLAIAAMIAAVVIPSLPGALESTRLRGCAVEVRATLTLARTLAVSESRSRSVAFDLGNGEYGIVGDDRKWLLPEKVRLAFVRRGDLVEDHGIVRIRFYPDGSADDAEVALSSQDGGTLQVRVDALTGLSGEGT